MLENYVAVFMLGGLVGIVLSEISHHLKKEY
jgi:hypothetical protein